MPYEGTSHQLDKTGQSVAQSRRWAPDASWTDSNGVQSWPANYSQGSCSGPAYQFLRGGPPSEKFAIRYVQAHRNSCSYSWYEQWHHCLILSRSCPKISVGTKLWDLTPYRMRTSQISWSAAPRFTSRNSKGYTDLSRGDLYATSFLGPVEQRCLCHL